MGSTVVASVSPNGEWFAGNRREKAAVGVLLTGKQWRRRSSRSSSAHGVLAASPRLRMAAARATVVAAGGDGSREPWRRNISAERERGTRLVREREFSSFLFFDILIPFLSLS